VFVLFSANAVQSAPGHWICTLHGTLDCIAAWMDWSGNLFNVYKRYKSFH